MIKYLHQLISFISRLRNVGWKAWVHPSLYLLPLPLVHSIGLLHIVVLQGFMFTSAWHLVHQPLLNLGVLLWHLQKLLVVRVLPWLSVLLIIPFLLLRPVLSITTNLVLMLFDNVLSSGVINLQLNGSLLDGESLFHHLDECLFDFDGNLDIISFGSENCIAWLCTSNLLLLLSICRALVDVDLRHLLCRYHLIGGWINVLAMVKLMLIINLIWLAINRTALFWVCFFNILSLHDVIHIGLFVSVHC